MGQLLINLCLLMQVLKQAGPIIQRLRRGLGGITFRGKVRIKYLDGCKA